MHLPSVVLCPIKPFVGSPCQARPVLTVCPRAPAPTRPPARPPARPPSRRRMHRRTRTMASTRATLPVSLLGDGSRLNWDPHMGHTNVCRMTSYAACQKKLGNVRHMLPPQRPPHSSGEVG